MTHAALILGHCHGMLNIRWNNHVVIHWLALFLLKLRFVQFLEREKGICQGQPHKNSPGLWDGWGHFVKLMGDSCTPLTSLLISLLWAVSRVSDRVVNEPDCIFFLLASLYLLWGWKLRTYNTCIVKVIKGWLVQFYKPFQKIFWRLDIGKQSRQGGDWKRRKCSGRNGLSQTMIQSFLSAYTLLL